MSRQLLAAAAEAVAWHRVPSHLISRLARSKAYAPTPAQQVVMPVLMPRTPSESARPDAPRAAVIQYPTGSGKTVAYAVPLIAGLDPTMLGRGAQAVIITPTRELCLQTLRTLTSLAGKGKANKKGNAVRVRSLMGRGTPIMLSELKHHPPDIVVGTPKTVRNLVHSGELLMASRRSLKLVLDEVDAMSDRTVHWEDIQGILSAARRGRPLWSEGSLWVVSATTPTRSTKPIFEAAGIEEKPTKLKSEQMMPDNVRHVALMDRYHDIPRAVKVQWDGTG